MGEGIISNGESHTGHILNITVNPDIGLYRIDFNWLC